MKTLVFASLLVTCAVHAQNFAIDWFTIDGGGGTSTGGVYSISGTIGQPDAGPVLTGGNYSLVGGFWSIVAAIQTHGAPLLTGNRAFLTLLGFVLAAWGAYAARLLVRDPDELARTENHPAWTQMYLLMMAAQVGFAVGYVL